MVTGFSMMKLQATDITQLDIREASKVCYMI